MAIAFHPPEISAAAPVHQATQNPNNSQHVVHQQFTNVPTGGIFILSPSSAVQQQQYHHHQSATALWVSTPQSVVGQQQMFSGFPPIFHNTAAVAVAAPQFHRVASYLRTPLFAPSPVQHQQQQMQPRHRCVTGAVMGCCTTCDDIRRGK